MLLSNLNPHIRYARIHKTTLHANDDTRVCYDCRVFFIDNAIGHIIIEGEKYDILNKTAVYLPPETKYKFHVDFLPEGKAIILDFDLTNDNHDIQSSLGTATEKTFDKNKVPPYSLPKELSDPIVKVMPQLDHLLTQCADNYLFHQPYYREISSAVLKLCLLEFIKQPIQRNSNKINDNVLAYIHNNFADGTMTNSDIAEKFNYHPNHLSNLIKQETGMSLHKYLINYRLRIAKNYLLTTQYDISEIAWRCGFCSEAYFIKKFRENVGETPNVYRRHKIHTEL